MDTLEKPSQDTPHAEMRVPSPERSNEESAEHTFATRVLAGRSVCGTCGNPITGDTYWNQWGPAHYSCIDLSG